ncbi:hypothetical protein QE152_g37564 [Popillia japonica]|uniref:Uncharacterized protein n=1 Tax=Popillia japonica TaxID=7064 RepID=A0AAW1IA61_POPJA
MLKTDSALCRWIFLFIAWIFLQRPWQIALKPRSNFSRSYALLPAREDSLLGPELFNQEGGFGKSLLGPELFNQEGGFVDLEFELCASYHEERTKTMEESQYGIREGRRMKRESKGYSGIRRGLGEIWKEKICKLD